MICTCYIGETESLGNPIIRKCALCENAPKLLKALTDCVADSCDTDEHRRAILRAEDLIYKLTGK